jgi:hypothetical protein
MYGRKIEYYADHAEALERQNIIYQPFIISCYGRPHPRTTAILRTLAKRVARRRGCSAAEWRYKRLRAAIAVEVWKRAAHMIRSCWPGKHEEDEQPLDPHAASAEALLENAPTYDPVSLGTVVQATAPAGGVFAAAATDIRLNAG